MSAAKQTLLGMTLAIESRFGCTPRNDIGTTLNTKFGVLPSRLPANPKIVQYFCRGVGGRYNDSTSGLSSAQPVLGTNMSLYAIRPFRAVPLAADLDSNTRANYAMRVVRSIGGVMYALYYLKKIDFTQSQVQYIRTDPTSGVQTAYNIDYSNLSPTPPQTISNSVITDIADQVSVVLPGTIQITGEEMFESMSVVDGGDTRFNMTSEIGFVSASAESVSTTDINGSPFTYTEAIMAQLTDQYDWVGQPSLSTADTWTRTMNFSTRNLILAS
jgi:hypothetical protein